MNFVHLLDRMQGEKSPEEKEQLETFDYEIVDEITDEIFTGKTALFILKC